MMIKYHIKMMIKYQIINNVIYNTIVSTYFIGKSSSSVYSPFSDRVGLPHHNTPFPGVLMKNIGAAFLQPNTLPCINHMCGVFISNKWGTEMKSTYYTQL